MSEEMRVPILPENLRTGAYANVFSISVSANETIIDFASSLPEPAAVKTERASVSKPIVVSRVILSREGTRKLNELLNDLLQRTP